MTVFVSLRDKTIHSVVFDDDHAFTVVRVDDGNSNILTISVNADTATIAIALADAIRAAALKYLPAPEPLKDEVPA